MLLLNYWTLAVFVSLFLISACSLVFRRKRLLRTQKTGFAIVCVISVLYLAFVLWLSIGFGSNGHPPAEPQPYNINSQLTENEINSLNNNADY